MAIPWQDSLNTREYFGSALGFLKERSGKNMGGKRGSALGNDMRCDPDAIFKTLSTHYQLP